MTHVKAGDRFGFLTAICELDGPGKRRWACRCDCGKETIAEATKLWTGHKKSCGCLRRAGAHLLKMTAAAALANRKPIVGLRFGRLVVLAEDGDSSITCRCRCDCGSTVQVRRKSLVVGDTKSCGCLQSERAKVLADNRAKKQRRTAGLPEDVPMSPHNLMLRNQFRDVSAQIKRRDNYTCALCHKRGVRLHVHHIERWSDNPDIRFDPMNLVTLCRDCHINRAHGGNVHQAPNADTAELLKSYVLTQRRWTCSDCGAVHDRDVNAARNILAAGHRRLAVGISGV